MDDSQFNTLIFMLQQILERGHAAAGWTELVGTTPAVGRFGKILVLTDGVQLKASTTVSAVGGQIGTDLPVDKNAVLHGNWSQVGLVGASDRVWLYPLPPGE